MELFIFGFCPNLSEMGEIPLKPAAETCRKAPRETDGMMELPGGEVLQGHFRAFCRSFGLFQWQIL